MRVTIDPRPEGPGFRSHLLCRLVTLEDSPELPEPQLTDSDMELMTMFTFMAVEEFIKVTKYTEHCHEPGTPCLLCERFLWNYYNSL